MAQLSSTSVFGSLTVSGVSVFSTTLNTKDWFVNQTAITGLYNSATGARFYSPNSYSFTISSNSNSEYPQLMLRSGYQGALLGMFYSDAGGVGLLNNSGNWAVRINYGSTNTGGNLYGDWSTTGAITGANVRIPTSQPTSLNNGDIWIA